MLLGFFKIMSDSDFKAYSIFEYFFTIKKTLVTYNQYGIL